MRGGGKGMVLEWRGLECFVCFGQGPSVLQGQGLQSQGLAQLPPSLHGDWENGAAGDGGRGVGMPSTWGCGGMWELLPLAPCPPCPGLCPGCRGARPVLEYKALFRPSWEPHACGSPRCPCP